MVAQAVATIALGLLGASGIAKLVDPEPTSGAMRAARLPASNLLSRLLGAVEVISAVLGLAVGGLAVIPAAILYVSFAIFTFRAVTNRIPLQTCGCFGREDTPPTAVHVAYNVASALALLAVPLLDSNPVPWSLPLGELLLYLFFSGIGVYASYLVLTLLPRLMSAFNPR